MKKLILATADAALVPCAASAMNVTLYGVADANISYFRNSESSITSMNSGGLGGSRWGLRGVEKISETLDAVFVLESGFNINTGTSAQGGALVRASGLHRFAQQGFWADHHGSFAGPGI